MNQPPPWQPYGPPPQQLPPPQWQPAPPPQRTAGAFANWGIGALAFVLVAIALMFLVCCGGAWMEAGHQIQKDEKQAGVGQ